MKPKKVTATEKKTKSYRKHFLDYPWLHEYKIFPKSRHKQKKYFYVATGYHRVKAIEDIINIEGPIHVDLLRKRLLNYFGFKREGPKIEDLIDKSLRKFESLDDFYYPEDFDINLVRIALDPKDDPRKFHQISDLELKNCMKYLMKEAFNMEKDELFLKTVQIFGYSSVSKTYRPMLEKVVKGLIREERLIVDGSKLKFNEEFR